MIHSKHRWSFISVEDLLISLEMITLVRVSHEAHTWISSLTTGLVLQDDTTHSLESEVRNTGATLDCSLPLALTGSLSSVQSLSSYVTSSMIDGLVSSFVKQYQFYKSLKIL